MEFQWLFGGIMLIKRQRDIESVEKLLQFNPVVAILGARQCGKTTLAK